MEDAARMREVDREADLREGGEEPMPRVLLLTGWVVEREAAQHLCERDATDVTHREVAAAESVLTEREAQVLRLVARGYASKEVAAQLDVSVKTVESHKLRAMEKLGLDGRVDLVQYAYDCGWLARG